MADTSSVPLTTKSNYLKIKSGIVEYVAGVLNIEDMRFGERHSRTSVTFTGTLSSGY